MDGQEDLLDLAWSEKDSGEVSANQELQSAHLVLLQEAFAAEGDGTSETKSISSTTSPPTEAIIGDIRNPFQDFRSPPASLQPDEQETAELEADLTASEEATSEFNVDPIDDQAVNDEPVPKLISAVMRGDLERIIELLDCAHDIESFHPENRRTGVIFATFLDYFDVLKCLLERGANIAAQDKDGRTALHFAASEGTCK